MALTISEKQLLREVICKRLRVTPQILADYATKTDAEIRVLLDAHKQERIAFWTARKQEAENKLTELK